jgi:two-component system nitrogen regulation response regulator NtrX
MSRILIVEDEKDLLELYSEVLKDAGHNVLEAASGNEGKSLIDSETLSLVITDKNMGKVSGLDVLKHCENVKPNLPVFIITGDSNGKIDFKNPKSRLIRKPFKFTELLSLISEL